MNFHLDTAEVYVPDAAPVEQALARTTHLCIAAHQDDIEIMAAGPIIECFHQTDRWFTGVVVTDGRGAPRAGMYAQYDDEAMRSVRFQEQRKAALIGEYAAQIMLDIPSKTIKDSSRPEPVNDILAILQATQPRFVYTHNLTDKHDTHVAIALRVIQALRKLDQAERPERVVGCEVWRGLDWMVDSDKVLMNTSAHENLQMALVGVFDSQIAGGKRYDLAALGRQRANATFFESHAVDAATGLSYGMDLTLLMEDVERPPLEFALEHIQRFEADVRERILKLS